MSSNLYFAPLLATNPNIQDADKLPDFPEALAARLPLTAPPRAAAPAGARG